MRVRQTRQAGAGLASERRASRFTNDAITAAGSSGVFKHTCVCVCACVRVRACVCVCARARARAHIYMGKCSNDEGAR